MYFDGSFSYEGTGAGMLIISPTGEHLKYVVQMDFSNGQSTNNTAEYKRLLTGLRAAACLGVKRLVVSGDSQLVVNQLTKEYDSPRCGHMSTRYANLSAASMASRWNTSHAGKTTSPMSYPS
jgi:ribonuclease HI